MSTHIRNLYFWQKANNFVDNCVVLITGAGSGIGQAVSLIYAERSCRIILTDYNKQALNNTYNKIIKLRQEKKMEQFGILSIPCDVTSEIQVKELMNQSIKQYHGIDILILCAGIGAHNKFSSTNNLDIFNKCMNVNFYGYLYCSKYAYKTLIDSYPVYFLGAPVS